MLEIPFNATNFQRASSLARPAALVLGLAGASASEAPKPGNWTALSIPRVCTEPNPAPLPEPLWNGSHLVHARASIPSEPRAPALSRTTFLQIVEESARASGRRLELVRQGDLALVRGEDEAVRDAQLLAAAFDSATDAFAIDLDVRLIATGAARSNGAPPANGPGAASTGFVEARRVRSGDEAFFGLRSTQAYVSSFDVEVAADAGTAAPVAGQAASGTGLHLTACRVEGGKRVHVHGLLDLAELAEMVRFDPGTPDLGVIEQPRVEFAQVVFSAVIDGGQVCVVELAGLTLARSDWKLEVRARTRPDAVPSAGWAVLDLAFLARKSPNLGAVAPGSGVGKLVSPQLASEAPREVPPSALVAGLEDTRPNSSGLLARDARSAALFWSHRLLFVPVANEGQLAEAHALVTALENARLASGRVTLVSGSVRATLPVTVGEPARFVCGSERAFLVDYRLEIAPQIWMPSPEVETTLDGIVVEFLAYERMLAATAWQAWSQPVREISLEDGQIGRLQALTRGLRSGSVSVFAGAKSESLLPALEGLPASLSTRDLGLAFVVP